MHVAAGAGCYVIQQLCSQLLLQCLLTLAVLEHASNSASSHVTCELPRALHPAAMALLAKARQVRKWWCRHLMSNL